MDMLSEMVVRVCGLDLPDWSRIESETAVSLAVFLSISAMSGVDRPDKSSAEAASTNVVPAFVISFASDVLDDLPLTFVSVDSRSVSVDSVYWSCLVDCDGLSSAACSLVSSNAVSCSKPAGL